MLFNSREFIFLFLPIVVITYFFLNRLRLTTAAKSFLVFASLFFYAWWKPSYLALLLSSILVNYAIGSSLSRTEGRKKKALLFAGLAFNLLLLMYYKYIDFLISIFNDVSHMNIRSLDILLPLAISFFTFQQIAYIVDSYKGETREYDFLNYVLFISFFPQLIAGPIVHHKEMMPQFKRPRNKILNYQNISTGLFIFFLGLFKKVVIADMLAPLVDSGYFYHSNLMLFESWIISIAYTMQIYYDFSGYCDMAIGIGKMLNINIPINFFSPYRSLNIREFWRRWHITLGRFLKDHIYIPLGGNRKGTYRNLFITFLLGGIWHGAGWTFVIWGTLHGIAMMGHRLWSKLNMNLPKILAWAFTFLFINVTWIFFRAENFTSAIDIIKGLLGINGASPPTLSLSQLGDPSEPVVFFKSAIMPFSGYFVVFFIASFLLLLYPHNSTVMMKRFKPGILILLLLITATACSIVLLENASVFLYFNF